MSVRLCREEKNNPAGRSRGSIRYFRLINLEVSSRFMVFRRFSLTFSLSSALLTLLISALFLNSGGSAAKAASVSSSDGASSSSSGSVAAVNLKQGDWIYSTHLDSDGNMYAAVTSYSGSDIHVEIPSELGGCEVRLISREAFSGNQYIVSVAIPDSVTEIGKYSFNGCVGLSSVTLPSSLKIIHEGAFYGCISLTEVVLPDSVTKLEAYAFSGCYHIAKVELSSSLKTISDYAFSGCSMLESANLESCTSLEVIGLMAFYDCSSLTDIVLPDSVTSLGQGAFMNCASLKSASLSDGLTELKSSVFYNCTELSEVRFGSGIQVIGDSAFEGCASLKSAELGDSVVEVGRLAFRGCSSMTKISFGANVSSIGCGALNECSSLSDISVSGGNSHFASQGGVLYSGDGSEVLYCADGAEGKVSLKDGAKSIAAYAFKNCAGVTEVVLPDGLEEIGDGAFLSCTSLTSLEVPESVTKLGCMAYGYYIYDGELKKATYLNVFGADESCNEVYCAAQSLDFTAFSETMLVNTERIVIYEGDTFDLICGFLTSHVGDASWSSSDESVASVDANGRVTAVSEGSAEITVAADGFEQRSVEVEVEPSEDDEDDVDEGSEETSSQSSRTVYRGESIELSSLIEALIDPIFDNRKFWYSSDPCVACVSSDGKVSSTGTGIATITCRESDGSVSLYEVSVVDEPVEFSVSRPSRQLKVGETVSLSFGLVPATSEDAITWKSSNSSVAQVDSKGRVTVSKQGSCTITASTASGLTSSVELECVTAGESIELDKDEISIYEGKEYSLSASVEPSESNETVKWRSSDATVASVNSKGRVVGVSFGTAEIYAELSNGEICSCTVNVIARAESLSLDTKNLAMNVGTEYQVNAIIMPSYTEETTDKCTWSSTDTSVATVDENGLISAVGVGSCIINCKISDEFISKCIVNVKLPAESVEISAEKSSIYVGGSVTLKAELTPQDTTDTVEWSSSDAGIATVTSNGVVKGVSGGTAVITLKVTNEVTGESVSAEFAVVVMVKADKITLSQSSISMKVGSYNSLTFTLSPSDSSDTITWYSSDESVAEVRSDGLITAKGAGECYVCVETGSGCTARCRVSVSE